MAKRTILNEIRKLNPERDHQRIAYLDAMYEFAFDNTRALEFALYRTFAVPSIGGLLHQTQEFEQRAQKRYDDTDLILSEIVENGYDSERGRAAIRRMNRQHGQYPISNDDYLYVLSTFIFEPIRWNARFGWRKMIENEKLAGFYFWRKVGQYMNIKDIPATYDEYERFNREYEREHFRYSEANRHVAKATRDMILGWYLPGPLKKLGEPGVNALMDDALLEAFGFPKPSPLMRSTVEAALKAKARFARLLPERRQPRSRTTNIKHRTYPNGYKIEELGPTIKQG
jgi:hypothetical protein